MSSASSPMSGKPSGVLTYSTGGVAHLEIERRYADVLKSEYRRGLCDGKKVGKGKCVAAIEATPAKMGMHNDV